MHVPAQSIIRQPSFYNVSIYLQVAIIGLLVCFGSSLKCWSQETKGFRFDKLIISTQQKRITFQIEIAETNSQRAQGLMWRKKLTKKNGMLFDYKIVDHVFMWMKNTLIPLDMIFISKSGRIINIVKDTTPHSTKIITSGGRVRAVLEVPAGTTSEYNIQIGDTIIHQIFDQKRPT
mgnify:CR=1 FL=1